MENLSSRWRFRTDMSSVRSASGTAYLIFQKLQMKECTRVRSNTTPEVEWTEAEAKNQRNRVEKSARFLFDRACRRLHDCSVCMPLYITKHSEAVLQWGRRKNIKKLMLNGELVIEWKKEKSIKDIVVENICYD